MYRIGTFCLIGLLVIITGCSSGDETPDSDLPLADKTEESNSEVTSMPEPEGLTLTLTIEIDPCTLITKQDAESLLGEEVGDAWQQEAIAPAGKSCSYSTQEMATSKKATVTIHSSALIAAEGIFDSAQDAYDRHKRAVLGSDYGKELFQAIDGLGSDACWDGMLRILQDDLYITLEVASLPVEGASSSEELQEMQNVKTIAAERTLAQIVLNRLP
ncbi:MAG: hypothetical protein HOC20_10205 [Chloroflexi bacterium]|jgi:hypothetical protein|nr:hypothetical protein [Chloroflexota bacterium]